MAKKRKGFFPWLIRKTENSQEYNEIIGDINEAYQYEIEAAGIARARLWYITQIILIIPFLIKNRIYWRMTMFKNYLKIAIRNISKYKLFSFINIMGLSIGIAACILISIWVLRETSYDDFHAKAGRIYRIERELFRDNQYSRWPITSGLYKEALASDFPEIEKAVRIWGREIQVTDHQDLVHRQGMYAVDGSIFSVFDFHLEDGDERTALTEPFTVVLTRQAALKYFGTADAVGRSLAFEWEGNKQADFRVTGILEEVPENSHIHFDMLISISSYPESVFNSWRSNYLFTYVLVGENTGKGELEHKLKSFVRQRLKPHYGDLLVGDVDIHDVLKMHLFPIRDIHLHPSPNWEVEAGGNIALVYIFSSIAFLILLVACINFINLSTARANKRAKEVSLRKTVGANRGQLRGQFIIESLVIVVIATILALFLISLAVPLYNAVFADKLSISLLVNTENILILIAATLAVGLAAGLYPAVQLTRFEPARIIKGGTISPERKSAFRRNMVVVQFVISIILVIGMFTVYKQLKFIHTQSLGFDRENVVLVPVRSSQVAKDFQSFRNELLQNTRILSVAPSSDTPGESFYSNTAFFSRKNPKDHINLIMITCDYDFIQTYRMEMLAGRSFSRDFSTDTPGTLILNEAAVKRIGWSNQEAVEETLHRGDPKEAARIVGVVKNFNFRSLRREVEPVALLLYPDYIRMISIRIMPGNQEETLIFIKERWHKSFPREQFEYGFLDNQISRLYDNDRKMQHIFIVFSAFSVLVACLGLFGLATYTASVRTKEIGIRKTLGATTANVTLLLSREFIKWVILANIAAWPLAWFIMNKWLENFAYKAAIGWFVFLISGFITLVFAVLTLSYQVVKAAQANPVDSLKYE